MTPTPGDIVLVGESKHPRRVIAVTRGDHPTVLVERVDGKADGCRYVTPDECRVIEQHPGGPR